ncbi:MAG: hypothetical protein QXQ77_02860 [Candidatus Aenigmatarchaeota archaeon]
MKIEKIKKELEEKLPVEERIKFLSYASGNIITILAKYLIKTTGYTTVSKVLLREIRELGKNDAEKIAKIFEIKEKTPENVSKILKIIALCLGLTLKEENGTYIIACPYGECVKKFKEPFICKICSEYNQGVIEQILGPKFVIKRDKYLLYDGVCNFQIEEKVRE